MKKALLFPILLVTCCLLLVTPVFAESKNIFGLHLTQPSDITSAASIINSSGGNWGWVTIVIRLDQLDRPTWQDFFDRCRRLHLIPIIRLATRIRSDGSWDRPQLSDIDSLANFLHSLNWPIQIRYILPFNETNHGSEWGGEVDVKNFADAIIYTYQKLKSFDQNYFILSSPLDLTAPEKPPLFKSAPNVYREIYLYRPEFFQSFDGLASHSYPNHGFVGTPTDTGQHSIRGYSWELDYLKNLGVNRPLSVFITETGWPHREGQSPDNRFYTAQTSADFFSEALKIWQQDPRITAVTPFIYNYSQPPFDHFSWLDPNQSLYSSFSKITDLAKEKNTPSQITSYESLRLHLPFLILANRQHSGKITLKNTGQSIWGETSFCLQPQVPPNVTLDPICTGSENVYPGQNHTFTFNFQVRSDLSVEKTYLNWQTLSPFEITPIDPTATLYRPKTNLLLRFRQLLMNLGLSRP